MSSEVLQVEAHQTKSLTIDRAGRYTVELLGAGAHVDIDGRFMLRGSEQLLVEVFIVHKAGHTSASTMLKGVAFDNARIKFFGRIMIDPGCPNTQSFLEERVLLLSDTAYAEVVPELEILSDDVKCSHAASVSRVPDEHLFYLQSRGLTPSQAESLIVEGFLEPIHQTDAVVRTQSGEVDV